MPKSDIRERFNAYIHSLRQIYADGDATELSGRAALETLLVDFAAHVDSSPTVRHEPKRVRGKGAPDFKIIKMGAILGYVENKAPGEPLDPVLKSDQIKRYRSLSENILVTDYLHWVWINKDGIQRESLCYETDLQNPKFSVRDDHAAAVAALIGGFFSTAPEGIGRAQTLALALATRSQLLRDFLGEELIRQEREHKEGRLFGLYEVFRDQVFHTLTLKEFADAFAQMLAYGLFLARLNSDKETVTLNNAPQFVPGSFRLIRELVDFLDVLDNPNYRDIRWVVEEVLSIVNGLDLAAIHEDLAFKGRKARHRIRAKSEEEWRLFSRDPFVYFYEGYLAKYDAKMRKSRGVYYTPPPIVNFIVRAIDDILKDTFGIAGGLADHKRVTVLEFACGTGTFLIEVLERIFENIGGPNSGKADLLIREHILKNLYGFEYLIAPYTIAHLKLSQYLRDRGHTLADDERFQIFLTNTLEPIEIQRNLLLPALTAETQGAQEVKEKPILVITGNPPYSGHSKNPSYRVVEETIYTKMKGKKVVHLKKPIVRKVKIPTFIGELIEDYKYVQEIDESGKETRKPLGEKNSKWLHDDYVKFIRFAQKKMEDVDEGIVGIITNHSFLDNPTFRGMRQSLMRTFDQIYLLDLHGNKRKKERAPDGGRDENVFDIEQGVAISLLIKKPGAKKGVWHEELWGKRISKYQNAMELSFSTTKWKKLKPVPEYFLFIPRDQKLYEEYERGWQVTDIFPLNGTGVITKRDKLCIGFSRDDVWDTVRKFLGTTPADAYRKFNLPDDVRDWSVTRAQADLIDSGPEKKRIQAILYRPFDVRFTYYTGNSRGFLGWPVERIMRHMLRDNIALLTARSNKSQRMDHFLVSALMSETKCAESTVQSASFPLYIYAPGKGQKQTMPDLFESDDPFEGQERIENLAPTFREWIDARYGRAYTPEEILGYIYAVLHAPTYRVRYREFLRINFPRIPFPESRVDFEVLSSLGWDLVQKHLLRDMPKLSLAKYKGKGDHTVEKLRYVEAEQAVYINKSQHFAPVPPEVWGFGIGGYQVIEKYLRSRKGRKLRLDEINQVERITDVLAYSIEQMAKIDTAYCAAFSR